MATRTDGVGTPGDSIQPMKKATTGEVKKLSSDKIELYKKRRPQGEHISQLGSLKLLGKLLNVMKRGPRSVEELSKQLDEMLKAGTIRKEQYDKIKAQIPKE